MAADLNGDSNTVGGTEAKAESAAPPAKQPLASHPTVRIDSSAYPHILEAIASHPASWAVLRSTCRAYREFVDRLAFEHIVVSGTSDAGRENAIRTRAGGGCGLPFFPPRDYEGWEADWSPHPRAMLARRGWTERLACARLLSFVRVLDLRGAVYSFEWGWQTLTHVQTLRLALTPTEHWRCWPTAPRVVLFPLSPTAKDAEDRGGGVGGVGFSRHFPKLVSNVHITHAGPIDVMVREVSTDEVVYIFTCLDAAKEKQATNQVGTPPNTWPLIARGLVNHFRPTLHGWRTAPTCTLVDLPAREITVDDFLDLVKTQLYLECDTRRHREIADELVQSIRIRSREEYAATLKPGDMELETVVSAQGVL